MTLAPHPIPCGCTHRELRLSPALVDQLALVTAPSRKAQAQVERMRHYDKAPTRLQLRVNTKSMWKQMTESTYRGGDLPFVAVREALQNGVDAIRKMARFTAWMGLKDFEEARKVLLDEAAATIASLGGRDALDKLIEDALNQGTAIPPLSASEVKFNEAVKAGKVTPGTGRSLLDQGRFEVLWDEATRTLTSRDNGIGMDDVILATKFLVLGESGKSAAGAEGEVGGFGVAKAVILGVGENGKWSLRTRDTVAETMGGLEVHSNKVAHSEAFPGTEVVAFDVPDKTIEIAGLGYLDVADRARLALGASEVGEIKLLVNGAPVVPYFPKDKGNPLPGASYYWGSETSARIKTYKRSDESGAFYVRLGGLLQFTLPSQASIDKDVVIDVTTQARPGREYPFTSSRENLTSYAHNAFQLVQKRFVKDVHSATDAREFDVFLPDAADAQERAGAERFAEQMDSLMDDPVIRDLMAALLGQAMPPEEQDFPGAGPTESAVPGQENTFAAKMADALLNAPDTIKDAYLGTDTKVQNKAAEAIRKIAEAAKEQEGYTRHELFTVANEIEQGTITPSSAEEAFTELASIGKNSPGLEVAGALAHVGKLIEEAVDASPTVSEERKAEVRKKRSEVNPFGTAAVIKVSRVNYDADKAKAFRRNAKKYFAMLVAWDAAARLLAKEYNDTITKARRVGVVLKTKKNKYGDTQYTEEDIDKPIPEFRVGFVLDDTCLAMVTEEGRHGVFLLIHPDRFQEIIDVHRTRPWAIAGYLHGSISHEFAHMSRGIGKGHDEAFTVQREDIDVRTTHLMPALEGIVRKAFKIKTKTPPGAEAAVRGAAWKATKAANDKWAKEIAEVRARLKEAEDRSQDGNSDVTYYKSERDRWLDKAVRLEAKVKQLEEAVAALNSESYRGLEWGDAAGARIHTLENEIADLRADINMYERTNAQTVQARANLEEELASARAGAISAPLQAQQAAIIKRLEGLVEYADFRKFLLGPGASFLPPGLTPEALIAQAEAGGLHEILADILTS